MSAALERGRHRTEQIGGRSWQCEACGGIWSEPEPTHRDGDCLLARGRPLDALAVRVHANARAKGFWDHEHLVVRDPVLGDVEGRPRNPSIDAEKIALMHSELSEALDAHRDGNMRGDHGVEEELADTIIRILDFAAARGFEMDRVIEEKIARNAARPRLHGRKW